MALDLPDAARSALVDWQTGALAGRSDLRAVGPDALHVTLAFLGHRPETEIQAISEAVGGAVDNKGPATLAATVAKPVPRRRPRLFALDLTDEGGRAGAVQSVVAESLSEGGFYEPEKRAFWPHLTIARVGRAERHPAPLASPPPADAFLADTVTLYRSHLGRGPARYEALERWALRPG